jgi:hypothetical protein
MVGRDAGTCIGRIPCKLFYYVRVTSVTLWGQLTLSNADSIVSQRRRELIDEVRPIYESSGK